MISVSIVEVTGSLPHAMGNFGDGWHFAQGIASKAKRKQVCVSQRELKTHDSAAQGGKLALPFNRSSERVSCDETAFGECKVWNQLAGLVGDLHASFTSLSINVQRHGIGIEFHQRGGDGSGLLAGDASNEAIPLDFDEAELAIDRVVVLVAPAVAIRNCFSRGYIGSCSTVRNGCQF